MVFKRLYKIALQFMASHPGWIEQWIGNKTGTKDNRNDHREDVNPGRIPEQDWGPFRRIPNVRGIEVKLGLKNALLALFGIEARFKPTFAYKAHGNHGMNKYMNYQIYRLRHLAKTDPKEYFKLMSRLLKQSKVLFLIGLNHVKPKWHRDFSMRKVERLYKQYVKISLSGEWKVQHKRMYIKKANGKARPLGVPSLAWRIHNHQVAKFLSLYLEEREFFSRKTGELKDVRLLDITKVQHGFRTGLGCKTAWITLLKEVTKATWIYEFDLSRCFSNIGIKAVSKALRKAGVPLQLIRKLEQTNLSPVQNPQILRTDTKETNEWSKWLASKTKKKLEDMPVTTHNNELIKRTPNANKFFIDNPHPAYEIQLDPEPLLSWTEGTEGDKTRGLPQGLPTSPVLTISALQNSFISKSKWNLLMYADDGIIYGDGNPPTEEEIKGRLNNSKAGIELNMEKSRFAKAPGQELDLKFLGMRIKGNTLRAETREGSTLVYDKHDLVGIYDMLENWNAAYWDHKTEEQEAMSSYSESDRYPVENEVNLRQHKDRDKDSYPKWEKRMHRTDFEKLGSSRLFGLIQSRLYQGEWNPDIEQCFELRYNEHSWCYQYDQNLAKMDIDYQVEELAKGKMNVFNSTSFACHDILAHLPSPSQIRKSTK